MEQYNKYVYAISEIEKCQNYENIMNIYIDSNLYLFDTYAGFLIFESLIEYWRINRLLLNIKLNSNQIELLNRMTTLTFGGDLLIFVKLINRVFKSFVKMTDPNIQKYLSNIKPYIIYFRNHGMYSYFYNTITNEESKLSPPNEKEIIETLNNIISLIK